MLGQIMSDRHAGVGHLEGYELRARLVLSPSAMRECRATVGKQRHSGNPRAEDQTARWSVSALLSLTPTTTHLLDILIQYPLRCANHALHEMKIVVPSGAGPIVVTQ